MDISLMRSIISQAASPPKAISSKRMFFVHLYKTTGREHTKDYERNNNSCPTLKEAPFTE